MPGTGSARQLIEAASAFVRREMLAEARQALQDARATLALRSDVGPAHWCDASLVALEIAARGGAVPEMETEAAQLRSLSGGGRYWTEQARARIAGHAGRIDPARLDRVFAILAGEANPTAPHPKSPPVSERAYAAAAECPLPLWVSSTGPLPAGDFSIPEDSLTEEPGARWTARLTEAADDLHSILVEDHGHARRLVDGPVAPCDTTDPIAAAELESAGLYFPEPSASDGAARRGLAESPPLLTASPGLHAMYRHRRRRQRVTPAAGTVALLALAAAVCISFVVAGLDVSFTLPRFSTAGSVLRQGDATHALRFASASGDVEATPRGHLLRSQALLAAGDTAGAVISLSAAAQSDSRGAIAWAAAETLARLPGRSAPAADAYLLAFAAGLSAERAETVARAQELAGLPARAWRVRQHADHGTTGRIVSH